MRRFAFVAFLFLGCARTSNDTASVPGAAECGDNPSVAGVCVGVLATPVCDGDVCTGDASCAHVRDARSDAELSSALAASAPGDCITLSPGNYGAIALPGGVSLLGSAARAVHVSSVAVAFTTPASSMVRGLTTASIRAEGRGSLTIDRVSVEDSSGVGIDAEQTDVSIVQSTVARSKGAGAVAGCDRGCSAPRPKLSLDRVWLVDNHRVGALGYGADAVVRYIVIASTHAEDFLYGRGLEVSGGGTLQASYLRVEKSEEAAVFIDGSAALLGPELEIDDSMRGVWLSGIPDGGVVLDGFRIVNTSVTALGFANKSLAITVKNGSIHATRSMSVPVDIGGVQQVGDGITWGAGVQATIESTVHIGASERLPALFDATARGAFSATLEDGDDGKGVYVKNGMAHPDLTIGHGIKVTYGEPASPAPGTKSPKP